MKFRHLKYFIAAAEELNFTHAADRLHVSQPPFSKQIHDLEGERGIELFDRRRKGVAVTPAGKAFLVDARRLAGNDTVDSLHVWQKVRRWLDKQAISQKHVKQMRKAIYKLGRS